MWGPWVTLGFGVLIVGLQAFVGVLVMVGFVFKEVVRDPGTDVEALLNYVEKDGDFLAVMTCIAAAVIVPVIVLLILIRKGASIRDYLGVRGVRPGVMLCWVGAWVGYWVIYEYVDMFLDRPVPRFWLDAYTSSDMLPLLWIALVAAAPLWEETLFRGFLFEGLTRSRWGVPATILITAAGWAAIHLQYDLFGIAAIFVLGLLFGAARLYTGSILTTLVLHALHNLIAVIQMNQYVYPH